MKRFLLSTVALVGFAGVASAADLPRRVAPPPVVPIVPAFTWTGFYFGVNAGAAFTVNDDDDDVFGDDRFGGDTIRIRTNDIRGSQRSSGVLRLRGGDGGLGNDDDSDVGFTGGGQIGFNYQFTPGSGFVVGLEADIQYIDIGGGDSGGGRSQGVSPADFTADRPFFNGEGVPNSPTTLGRGNSFGAAFDPRPGQRPATRVVRGGLAAQDLNYFGTVRGRLGYAFDRTLIYATGGFAYGGGDSNNNDDGLFNDNGGNGGDEFKYGWTVGGGVEFAFSNFQLFGSSTMTFKIEGLYVNLSEDDNGNGNTGVQRASYSRRTQVLRLPSGGGNNNDETEFAVVRAGVNFKF
jgi:outer membrane immunogenic protein